MLAQIEGLINPKLLESFYGQEEAAIKFCLIKIFQNLHLNLILY